MVMVLKNQPQCPSLFDRSIPEEPTDEDRRLFFQLVNIELSQEQTDRISNPELTYPRQREILAVHWHPEFVPLELCLSRTHAMFPGLDRELIIPTQHNVLLNWNGYCGVEVDCYSRAFDQKVQLLLHFDQANLQDAGILLSMLEHTRKYRASQLFDFIETIAAPKQGRLEYAARETGADQDLVTFIQITVRKIKKLLDEHLDSVPEDMIKNKLLRNFFDGLRPQFGHQVIDRAQAFLKTVKQTVKANFSLQYFYRTSEIIEEARKHQAGIIVPHPEQFWPILLAEYDVDGYEVWNPQSQRYTDFLISVVNRKNRELGLSKRRLLIFMGDDTHMGEKVKDPELQDLDKASREIGLQPAWDDLSIQKMLIKAHVSRAGTIEEYLSRLQG